MATDDAGDAKGSRPKVVGLKLRYKSATVDEFIEKYALDVSPRGIYVNIAKPLAVGTLVKLEIRLANEQVVIKGVGSVLGNRDRAQASGTRPVGLWIKFIQIDEPSKAFIEKLVSARADAGPAYEEHGEKKEEDAIVVGSLAQSHQEAPALPIPAAPRLRATLVGIVAPATPPARPRMPSLPPGPVPLPAKAPYVPPPRGTAPDEHGVMDAEDATVVWGEAPTASTRETSLMGVTPPPPLPARPRLPSLPPPPVPPPRPRLPSSRAYEEQWERDAEDDTVIWDHKPSRRDISASLVPAASPRKPTLAGMTAVSTPGARPVAATVQEGAARREASLKTTVIRRRSPALSPHRLSGRTWGRTGAWVASGFFAVVALALAIRSGHWFGALTPSADTPGVAREGATSATAAMTSTEMAPVPARSAVENLVDAAPAATTPAEVAGALPTMGTLPQPIAAPIPAPSPKPAPAARNPTPRTRAASPGDTDISTIRTKPKPKPAPTIDDGF
jgi:uncharacterized protein (TIGR02266 family)